MNWLVIAQIIAQYGVPVAESIFVKWQSNAAPTQADWDELKTLATQTAQDRMKIALTGAGIALDDPKAVALLALTAL